MRRLTMRLAALLCLLPCLGFGQGPPLVGTIEIYGARKTSRADILEALGIREGGRLQGSKGDMEDRVEDIEGVVAARVEAACCETGKVILYVGVQERGAPSFEYRAPPAGDSAIPEDVRVAYADFLQAVRNAGPAVGEDLTRGHSLMSDPAVRKIQSGFITLADRHADALRRTLRESPDPEQRAIAVYVLGYATDKAKAVLDVQYALQDIDDTVRGNAIRALAALAVLERKDPKSGVRVAPTWLIEMLNSVTWTDRHNAAVALVTLTETRDPGVLAHLRERAMPALNEMARWKHLPHALPPYILLGRAAGIPEAELQDAWSKDARDQILKRAAASNKR